MQKIALPAQWSVRAVSPSAEVPTEIRDLDIPAQVPGCVHLDLLRENLIPDPYLGDNEKRVQWIGRTDWEFSTTFSLSADALKEERVDLVCEGLDTVATIWINGAEIGHSENMHVEARFEAKAALREGDNEIRIRFDSPVLYARQMRDRLGDLPHANSYPDWAICRTPTPIPTANPSTSSAKTPVTSAGTGGQPSPQAASGKRFGWKHGQSPASNR